MIRAWLRRRWVAHRRRRLLAAYAMEFKLRTGKRVGFSPYLYALQQAEKDGVLESDGGEIIWKWPEEDG